MNAAIEVLNRWADCESLREKLAPAIAVLRDWPRWEKLVEAAGTALGKPGDHVRERLLLGLDCFTDIEDDEESENGWWKRTIRTLLAAIPEEK